MARGYTGRLPGSTAENGAGLVWDLWFLRRAAAPAPLIRSYISRVITVDSSRHSERQTSGLKVNESRVSQAPSSHTKEL